jgi:hypothetical protein
MSSKSTPIVATMGIDIGKNSRYRPRSARRDRAAAEVVTQPDRGAGRQHAASCWSKSRTGTATGC